MKKYNYNFDFYPDCIKGVLPIKERSKILGEWLRNQDDEYILALYDKMHNRVTDLRIEQEITKTLRNAVDCNKETIKELQSKNQSLKSEIERLSTIITVND